MAEVTEKAEKKAKAEVTEKAEAKKVYRCIRKCYAEGLVYREGDTCEGVDLDKNPNFEVASK